MKICGQTYVELDATLENLEEILEYLKENLWTFRRKIGTFKRLKIDAGLEHLEEISLINLKIILDIFVHTQPESLCWTNMSTLGPYCFRNHPV